MSIKKDRSPSTSPSKNILTPFISPSQTLPEITVKSVLLGIILAVIMAAANAYLGLKVGMTVSATIPAAVISMGILRLFRSSNILENNLVQTTASAGEVIAAGSAFTLPALIMMHYWTEFSFWETTMIVSVGGILGVLLSIPLRRALVVEGELKFPEGIAAGEVLKAGETLKEGGAKDLVYGGLISVVIKFCQSGLGVMSESLSYWTKTTRTVFGFETGLSMVLMGAGYIVGWQIGFSMVLGGIIAWCIGTPLYAYLYGMPDAPSAYLTAVTIWNSKLRMMGIGTMVVAGLWTIVLLIDPMRRAIAVSFKAMSRINTGSAKEVLRTDRDIPFQYVLLGILVICIPMIGVLNYAVGTQGLDISGIAYWGGIALLTLAAVIMSFFGSAIGGYIAGLIGSSNAPISAIAIMVVLLTSVFLFMLYGTHITSESSALGMAGLTIVVAASIACAAAVSCDNLQDLKAGQIVGATPWKQQFMLIIGVIAGSLAIAPVLQILFEAHGFGDVLPREGMNPAHALAAPKAALVGTLAKGVFTQTLDWNMVLIGAGLGVVMIFIDESMKRSTLGWHIPPLAIALGIYMPLEITVPVLLGGLISFFASSKADKSREKLGLQFEHIAQTASRRGILFASGLIAGESLLGIVLAFFFATYQNTSLFRIAPEGFESIAVSLGTLAFIGFGYYLYKISSTLVKK